LKGWGATWVIDSTSVLLVLIGIVPAIYVTALVVTEIIAMPVIVKLAECFETRRAACVKASRRRQGERRSVEDLVLRHLVEALPPPDQAQLA